MMMSLIRLGACLLLAAAGLTPSAAWAQFLAVRNEASLARGFGLPVVGQTSLADERCWRLSLDLSNEYHLEDDSGESLLLDGESARYTLGYAQRITERVEIGLSVPLLHLGGGFLDGPIEDWHEWFSLPNGGREDAPQDQYRFFYVDGGVERLDATETGTYLGDVEMLAGLQWAPGKLLRVSLQLPTGDTDALAGNGAAAAALWLDRGWRSGNWSAYGSVGGLYAARGDVLAHRQRQWAAFGGLGVGWQAWPVLRLMMQLNGHTPLYENVEADALQRPGVQLAIGAALRLGAGRELRFGFQEDPSVAASPDFSLHLALHFE